MRDINEICVSSAPSPRVALYLHIVGMLENCRHALRIATEMQDQPLVGLLAEQEKKLVAMVEEVANG